MKSAIFLFLMLTAISTENENEDTLLCLKQELAETLHKRAVSKKSENFCVQNQNLQDQWDRWLIAEENLMAETLHKRTVFQKVRNQSNAITREPEKQNEVTNKQLSKVKIIVRVNLYPNKSSIKVFRDLETEQISWKDPNELVEIRIKKLIEVSLQQKGKTMSNHLFSCIFDWNVPADANPFVKELLFGMSKTVDVERRGSYNSARLMIAAKFDADKAVAKLIERGAETEDVDSHGWTATHWAASFGSIASCKVLLNNGANVNAQNIAGYTALMLAAMNADVKFMKLLLQFAADTKIKNKHDGRIALQLARGDCCNVIEEHETNLKEKHEKIFTNAQRYCSQKNQRKLVQRIRTEVFPRIDKNSSLATERRFKF